MKTLTLLKIITILLAFAIATGLIFVVYKITCFDLKSKPQQPIQAEIPLHFPEAINTVLQCGDKLCIMTIGHENGRRLLIIDPHTGKLSSTLTFKDRM